MAAQSAGGGFIGARSAGRFFLALDILCRYSFLVHAFDFMGRLTSSNITVFGLLSTLGFSSKKRSQISWRRRSRGPSNLAARYILVLAKFGMNSARASSVDEKSVFQQIITSLKHIAEDNKSIQFH